MKLPSKGQRPVSESGDSEYKKLGLGSKETDSSYNDKLHIDDMGEVSGDWERNNGRVLFPQARSR